MSKNSEDNQPRERSGRVSTVGGTSNGADDGRSDIIVVLVVY